MEITFYLTLINFAGGKMIYSIVRRNITIQGVFKMLDAVESIFGINPTLVGNNINYKYEAFTV